jgi:hypothetical protein
MVKLTFVCKYTKKVISREIDDITKTQEEINKYYCEIIAKIGDIFGFPKQSAESLANSLESFFPNATYDLEKKLIHKI